MYKQIKRVNKQAGGAFIPFGSDSTVAKSQGWTPMISSNTGATYRNNYNTAFNSVIIPGQKEKGYVSLVGRNNHMFDMNINDSQGNIQKSIYHNVPFSTANEYFTNQASPIAQRVRSIQAGVNSDRARTDGTYVSLLKGGPSPEKAHEMLRDGTAHGKKLTPKQKRYFGFIYGSSKRQEGGLIPDAPFFSDTDEISNRDPMMELLQQMKKGGTKKKDPYFKSGGNWIKGAVNPSHRGFCTPMTKSTCTPRRKAFAMTMKKHHGFHKEEGGFIF